MITLTPDIEQLARRVAARSGRTPEDVLKDGVAMEALIAGIVTTEATTPRAVNMDRVRKITQRVSRQPLRDPRSPREIADEAWDSPA
jgi:antitoxin VapB